MSTIQDFQKLLFPDDPNEWDGVWGNHCKTEFEKVIHPVADVGWFSGKASSFADPADIHAFDRCKAQGKSDQECFKVGDNGIGCWGDSTKEGSGPCCAIPGRRMTEKWGSRDAAKHKKVEVSINGKSLILPVKDRQSDNLASGAIIDLNPDAGAFFGLKPPFLVSCAWRWV